MIAAFTRETYIFLDMFHIEIDCGKYMGAFEIGMILFIKTVHKVVFAARHSLYPVGTRTCLTMYSIIGPMRQMHVENACRNEFSR